MAALFAIYLISLLLIVLSQRKTAFAIVIINLILSSLLFLDHSTDIFRVFL